MAAGSNKRRYTRTRAQNLVAHLRIGDRVIQAPIDDISMGGMLARTNESVAIGTALMFDLARPGLKKPMRLLGVVVDTRVGRGLGIRFDGLDTEAGDRLGDLIAELGGTASASLLVDRPDLDGAPPQTSALPAAVAPPAPSASSYRTGPIPIPARAAAAPQHTETELRLAGQMRSMVMEVGRLQEILQQREKELHDARAEIARLRGDASAGDASQRLVGRLEIEKNKLEGQLAELRSRSRLEVDTAQREAEQAIAGLGRVLDSLKRLRG